MQTYLWPNTNINYGYFFFYSVFSHKNTLHEFPCKHFSQVTPLPTFLLCNIFVD